MATTERDPRLDAARRRRLLARLDKALAARGVKPPPKRAAVPAAATLQGRLRARVAYEGARRSWDELKRAIQAEGGIQPNRDFAASEIPRELRARRGRGLAPDEMADVLGTHGLFFDGDDDLIQTAQRRRERLSETHEGVRAVAARHNPSEVCSDNCRDPHGMFAKCENAARAAVRTCRQRWRDAIGRFREDPRRRRF